MNPKIINSATTRKEGIKTLKKLVENMDLCVI